VVERLLHWAIAVLVMAIMTTGAVLFFGPLSGIVGRRELMKQIHVWSGAAACPCRSCSRCRAVASWAPQGRGPHHPLDGRRPTTVAAHAGPIGARRLGKFNAGQKLNALFVAGVLPVMLLTGSIMKWFHPFPDSWRTGATFVHDVGAYGVWITVTGHILKALAEPEALRSIVWGRVRSTGPGATAPAGTRCRPCGRVRGRSPPAGHDRAGMTVARRCLDQCAALSRPCAALA